MPASNAALPLLQVCSTLTKMSNHMRLLTNGGLSVWSVCHRAVIKKAEGEHKALQHAQQHLGRSQAVLTSGIQRKQIGSGSFGGGSSSAAASTA